jgi:hypothetical protein
VPHNTTLRPSTSAYAPRPWMRRPWLVQWPELMSRYSPTHHPGEVSVRRYDSAGARMQIQMQMQIQTIEWRCYSAPATRKRGYHGLR